MHAQAPLHALHPLWLLGLGLGLLLALRPSRRSRRRRPRLVNLGHSLSSRCPDELSVVSYNILADLTNQKPVAHVR